jgi:hypothetical protein
MHEIHIIMIEVIGDCKVSKPGNVGYLTVPTSVMNMSGQSGVYVISMQINLETSVFVNGEQKIFFILNLS